MSKHFPLGHKASPSIQNYTDFRFAQSNEYRVEQVQVYRIVQILDLFSQISIGWTDIFNCKCFKSNLPGIYFNMVLRMAK